MVSAIVRIYDAVENNNPSKALKILRDEDVTTNINDEFLFEDRNTCLHLAVKKGMPKVVRELLTKGADVHAIDVNRQTPLHWAVNSPNLSKRIVKHLIEAGSLPSSKDKDGLIPMHLLCLSQYNESEKQRKESLRIFKVLLDKDPDSAGTPLDLFSQQYPLHLAAQNARPDIIRLLLRKKTPTNIVDKFGRTPLHILCEEEMPSDSEKSRASLQVVRLLLEADPELLHLKIKEAPVEGKKALYEGQTAFHRAAGSGRTDLIRYFIECGVDKNAKEDREDGQTAADIAKTLKHQEVFQFLEHPETGNYSVFTLPLVNEYIEEGDSIDLVCCLQGQVEAATVTWYKNGKLIQSSDTSVCGKRPTLQIKHATPDDVGDYKCQYTSTVGHEESSTGKLHVIDLFSKTRELWTEDEKEHLMKTCRKRILMAGKSRSGKTSLTRTILKSESYLTKKHDRTFIVDYQFWKVDDEKCIPIFDIGGHSSYIYTAHLFHSNDDLNLVVLVHDIQWDKDEDYIHTFSWLKDIITHSPKCTMIPVLSKSDKIQSTEEQKRRVEKFKEKFVQLIDEEVKAIKIFQQKNEGHQNDENRKRSEVLENVFKKIKEEIQNHIILVSCVSECEDSVKNLVGKLLETCSNETILMIPDHYQFYKVFGLEGIEETLTQADQIPVKAAEHHRSELHEMSRSNSIPKGIQESRPNTRLQIQPLINTEGQTSVDIGKSDHALTSMPSQIITTQSCQQKNASEKEKTKPYIHYSEGYKQFCELLHMGIQDKGSKEDFEKCLSNLHSLGLMMWYGNTSTARDLVFTDLLFFVKILKVIFNHKYDKKLTFNNLSEAQQIKMEGEEHRFKLDVENLKSRGKMSKALLSVLLCELEFEEYSSHVIDILETLNICLKIPNQDVIDSEYFFPWFSEQQNEPDDLKDKVDQMKISTGEHFVMRCELRGNIPRVLFHHLCISLSKKFGCPTQENRMWKGNMWMELGDLHINMTYSSPKCISLVFRASCTNLASFKDMWECIDYMSEELERYKSQWGGLIIWMIIVCSHCILNCKLIQKEWPVKQLLQFTCRGKNWIRGGKCDCNQDKIPAAFLHPMPKDEELARQGLNDLKEYLQKACHEKKKENGSKQSTSEGTFSVTDADGKVIRCDKSSQDSDELKVIIKAMQKCYEFSMQHMDPAIRTGLFSNDLINSTDRERARNKDSQEDSCEYLLEVLSRKICSKELFVKFLTVLEDGQQTKLKEKYQEEYKECGGTSADVLDV